MPDNTRKITTISALEAVMDRYLRSTLISYEPEYRFVAEFVGGAGKGLRSRLKAAGLHDWRFDFAIPDKKIAIECEGGTWTNGRHTRGAGFENDCNKYNNAALLGWKVYRFTGSQIRSGEFMPFLDRALKNRP